MPKDIPMFDRDALLERMGDEGLVNEVLEVFLLDVPVQLEKLGKAIDEGDFDLAALEGHSLKGAAMNVSADYFEHCARELESAARINDRERVMALYGDLRSTFGILTTLMNPSAPGGRDYVM